MRRALALSLVAGGAVFHACAQPHLIPDDERLRVSRELSGRPRWLRVAAYVGPFYSDDASALVTDQPPEELELLETPGGTTIHPPAADRILPPGTPVLLREVEFPTPGAMMRRFLTTPRYHPWARLEVAGESRPAILVLPQEVKGFEDVRAALDRVLADRDTRPDYQALPEAQRKAVARKELLDGMGARAVAMSWGYPERMIVDRPAGKEQWIWAGGRRRAWLEDDRLIRFEGR